MSESLLLPVNKVDDDSTMQLIILKKLEQILADVQMGKRESSVISTRNVEDPENEVWDEISKELQDEGISRDALIENKDSIVQWIKHAIESGAWIELEENSEDPIASELWVSTPSQFNPQSSSTQLASEASLISNDAPKPPAHVNYSWNSSSHLTLDETLAHQEVEVLSATWGPMDVTERVRQFFKISSKSGKTTHSFVPSNTFFGHDP